ncbi:hypothetical protein AALB16_11305 [Lachnospiraceae bacterium 62-35]
MDERIYQIAEQIVEIHQKAYEVYLPLVEDVCSRIVSEAELSHLLDYLLDLHVMKKYWGCIKRCAENIYMYIRGALNLILKRIGKCGKMKTNDYLAEYI